MYHEYNMEKILEDLRSPSKKNLILDTDTYNEIDDQFAIAYAMLSDNINLLALTAAPFEDHRAKDADIGMELSYQEMIKIRDFVDPEGKMNIPCYRGSEHYMPNIITPVHSEAAENIVRIVNETDGIVYVAAIGALTNVTSAILKAPDIIDKICVLFVGCRPLFIGCPVEYNVEQDYKAAQLLFESGVNLIIVPDANVTQKLRSPIDCVGKLKGANPVCDYLYDISYNAYRAVGCPETWARTIWDLGAPAMFETPECATVEFMPRPILTDEQTYAYDDTRPEMIMVTDLDRDPIFEAAWAVLKRGKNE